MRLLSIVAVLGLAAGVTAHGHEHTGSTPSDAELGAVSFQTSCRPEVSADINRGVALIHSFWHEEARVVFEKVATDDPECAMAYWGRAMAMFHLYSSTPSEADLAAIPEVLKKAEAAREKNAREAQYLSAFRALYEGFTPREMAKSAQRFADAMAGVVAKYPDDIDAKAFYALGLLAANPPGDVTLAHSKRAVETLYPAFRKHPEHPGLAHYIIHACDNPQMAQQGLEAARSYASIAPAAPHALHMPSHIFARLGLWEDDIRSNLASKAAAENTSGPRIGAENRLHAMEFLEYAYLQSGQVDKARAIVEEARTVRSADTSYPDYYLTVQARFGLLLAVETQDWDAAASLKPVDGAHWYSEAHTLLAHAMAAGHKRDAQAGAAAVKRLDELLAKADAPKLPAGSSSANLRDEIYAWSAFAGGDTQRALALLRPVADTQSKTGKGEVEIPAREMLAEILLLSGDSAGALTEFKRSLATDPNRLTALRGAAQATETENRR